MKLPFLSNKKSAPISREALEHYVYDYCTEQSWNYEQHRHSIRQKIQDALTHQAYHHGDAHHTKKLIEGFLIELFGQQYTGSEGE